MYPSVQIYTHPRSGSIKISSRPESYSLFLFAACAAGLCALPFTSYRNDSFAYAGLLFVLGLTTYYFVLSIQSVRFEKETNIKVRKGLRSWKIPFESVSAGRIIYYQKTSGQTLKKTHYLSVKLQVNLPDNKRHYIRNKEANIFHYGFNQWGTHQEFIRKQFAVILKEKGIPIVQTQSNE